MKLIPLVFILTRSAYAGQQRPARPLPGMLKNRTFHIVFVTPNHGTGIPQTDKPDATVTYTGASLTIHAVRHGA
jgi:hypothetical protein